ncbi:hypothetical protein AC1031_005151 [Aphanomyces cochlioides]|nr:hypothetical protein AC1031_005151 [Aphanomyces cochlioides]
MRGNMDMATFLESQLEHDRSNTSMLVSSIQRGLLTETIKGIFQLKQVESLPWLLNLWARYLPRTWSARCRQESRYFALDFLCLDVLKTLTKGERRPFDKYAEDLSYAIKISSLSAVKYLHQRANKIFKFSHVLEAIIAWHSQKPTSADIMERTLSLWLDSVQNPEEKLWGVVQCVVLAFKRGLGAMLIVWGTKLIPYTQSAFTIAEPQSIDEFMALDLLPRECYQSYQLTVKPRVKTEYLRAAREIACATDEDGNLLHKQPVAIRSVHKPGDTPKFVVDS